MLLSISASVDKSYLNGYVIARLFGRRGKYRNRLYTSNLGEALNNSSFYGKPAQLCDAGVNKIKALAPLILSQKFPHLFNQYFLRISRNTKGDRVSLYKLSTGS